MITTLTKTLYTIMPWHPSRIQTLLLLITAVIQSKSGKIKDLALYMTSKNGKLKAKVAKVGSMAITGQTRQLFDQREKKINQNYS